MIEAWWSLVEPSASRGPAGAALVERLAMCQIELSDEEREVLDQILQNARVTLELEIQRTDHLEFKELLRHRRSILERLIEKTERVPVAA